MTEGQERHDHEQDDDKGARERMGDGIRSGIGILSAFKDSLEESIREARERGDLSADRAKELLREALDKAQSAASGARERLDFVHQSELDELKSSVEALQERVAALEARIVAEGTERQTAAEEDGEEGS